MTAVGCSSSKSSTQSIVSTIWHATRVLRVPKAWLTCSFVSYIAARPMADDMRLAARVINRLVEEIRTVATTTNGAIAHIVDLVGWQ
jgi:hypothetical protein